MSISAVSNIGIQDGNLKKIALKTPEVTKTEVENIQPKIVENGAKTVENTDNSQSGQQVENADKSKSLQPAHAPQPVQQNPITPYPHPQLPQQIQYAPVQYPYANVPVIPQESKKINTIKKIAKTVLSVAFTAAIFYGVTTLLRGGLKRPRSISGLEFKDLSNEKGLDDLALPESLKGLFEDIKTSSNPEELTLRGGEPIKSILLYGPPGTGKTTFAKALAKQSDALFASIDIGCAESKYVGESEQNIVAAINAICKKADQNPSKKILLFIDEIDSVMKVDNGTNNQYSTKLLNTFKKCFSEDLAKRSNIITVGATNFGVSADEIAKQLDKPMLDRFNRHVFVGLPNKGQIQQAWNKHYQNCTSKYVKESVRKLDEKSPIVKFLADEAKVSFRNIENIWKGAASKAAQRKDNTRVVTVQDIFDSIVQQVCGEKTSISEKKFQDLADSIGARFDLEQYKSFTPNPTRRAVGF